MSLKFLGLCDSQYHPGRVIFRTKQIEEDSPEIADLYLAYGKALLENAISQNTVLGKDEPGEGGEEDEGRLTWCFHAISV